MGSISWTKVSDKTLFSNKMKIWSNIKKNNENLEDIIRKDISEVINDKGKTTEEREEENHIYRNNSTAEK